MTEIIIIPSAGCSGNLKIEQRKKGKKQKKYSYIQAFSKNKSVLWIRQPEQVDQQVTPPIQMLMITYHNIVKQSVLKRNILGCVSVGKK